MPDNTYAMEIEPTEVRTKTMNPNKIFEKIGIKNKSDKNRSVLRVSMHLENAIKVDKTDITETQISVEKKN